MARTLQVDRLSVVVSATAAEAGHAAGEQVARHLRELTADLATVKVVFAAAPSQTALLAYVRQAAGIQWRRVHAYQMDEYIGLAADAPQRFGQWLRRNLFDHVPLQFHPLDPGDDAGGDDLGSGHPGAGYLGAGREEPVDLVCLGIGENGHLAFNDPPLARFDDESDVRMVELDVTSREQQVHDGLFPDLDDVPTHALTLTIPRLLASRRIVGVACGRSKTVAVQRTLSGDIDELCPATALRTHAAATLHTDDAAYPM